MSWQDRPASTETVQVSRPSESQAGMATSHMDTGKSKWVESCGVCRSHHAHHSTFFRMFQDDQGNFRPPQSQTRLVLDMITVKVEDNTGIVKQVAEAMAKLGVVGYQ